jgi:pyrimidine-nucleoside phosphorylase
VIPPAELIQRKRDGEELEVGELAELVLGYARGDVPDYQMAAFCMAVYFRGLSSVETFALTDAMIRSGKTIDLGRALGRKVVDKHSTGGVGDKTSIAVGPIVAACGVPFGKMSGRGLGHTGGTLDKLESIPGFRVELGLDEFVEQVRDVGLAIIGQSADLVPADKRLYALRDVTGTVESIPLIAASIMSKKLAEGLTGLVLDVKTGSGAFMPQPERAIELARTMIGLGEARGCPTVALLTAMDRPLGRACGNALEVEESIEGLRGDGPEDLMEVTYALGAEMLLLVGAAADREDARRQLREAVDSGRALETFARIIEAQGGNPAVVEDPGILPQARAVEVFRAPRSGVVSAVEPRRIGRAIVELGGGRRTVEDEIDPAVGFVITVKPGDPVRAGEPVASVFAGDENGIALGLAALGEAVIIGEEARRTPLISHRITAAGVEPLGPEG